MHNANWRMGTSFSVTTSSCVYFVLFCFQFALRSEIAKKQEIPPYNVLGAVVLKQLAKRRPVDLGVLETVDGMSHKKVVDYGADIIKARQPSDRDPYCTHC